jgi:HEAT repeat protein
MRTLALVFFSIPVLAFGQITLGESQILGRTIAVEAPDAPGPIAEGTPHVEIGGWRYVLGPDGRLGHPHRIDGGWRDVGALHRSAEGRVPVATWKSRVFLLSRCEVTEKGADGVLRMRRSSLERVQIDAIAGQLALFQAMTRAFTGGALRMELTISIDADHAREFIDDPGDQPFGEAFVRRDLRPRWNLFPFASEDREERGPFHGVFVIHGGLAADMPTTVIDGTPVTAIAYNTNDLAARPGGLALAMWRAWQDHLAEAFARAGWPRIDLAPGEGPDAGPSRVGPGSAGFVPAALWSRLTKPADDDDWVDRRWPRGTPVPRSWTEVEANPIERLAQLPIERALALIGVDALTTVYRGDRLSEAFASDQGEIVLARLPAAGEVARRLGADAVGWTAMDGGLWIVFRSPESRRFGDERSFFGAVDPPVREPSQPPGRQEFRWRLTREPTPWSVPLVPRAYGSFRAETISDPDSQPFVQAVETGPARRGGVELMPEGQTRRLQKGTSLRLRFRSNSRDSLAIHFEGWDRWVMLVGNAVRPLEASDVGRVTYASAPADGQWQEVAIPVEEDAIVTGLRLAPGPWGTWRPRSRYEAMTTGVELVWRIGDPVVPAPGPTPSEAEVRLRAIAEIPAEPTAEQRTELAAALSDNDETVRLNAVWAFARIKAPDAVPALIDQARSATAQIAEAAVAALAHQDVAEGWDAVRGLIDIGPFEANRAIAARALVARDPKPAPAAIVPLWPSQSWRVRRTGAEAVASIPGRQAGAILMTWLQELDPCVRLAATLGADVELELVNRRLLWASVNDPSETVRAASFVKLLASPLAEYRAEATKGVRDESPAVRLAVLEAIRTRADERDRGALRIAVIDRRAEVRAAALRGFAAMPGRTELAEIENVLTDADPRVQTALLDLAKSKGLELPDQSLRTLRESRDPNVAARARGEE